MSELAPIEAYCAALISKLSAPERQALARQIATQMRTIQAKRIAAQINPDGSAYAPRKNKLRSKTGSIRRTMFTKLRTAKYLKVEATPLSAIVTFTSEVQRIAQVHHYGLRDKVDRKRSLEVKYEARKLLGITHTEIELVQDLVITHLAR